MLMHIVILTQTFYPMSSVTGHYTEVVAYLVGEGHRKLLLIELAIKDQ